MFSLLPKETISIVLSYLFTSKDIRQIALTCKQLHLVAKKPYLAMMHQELEKCVYNSKPFFPSKMRNMNQKEECIFYKKEKSSINIRLGQNYIGFINWTSRQGKRSSWICGLVVTSEFVDRLSSYLGNPQLAETNAAKYSQVASLMNILKYDSIYIKSLSFDKELVNYQFYIVWDFFNEDAFLQDPNWKHTNLAQAEKVFWHVWSIYKQF